MSPVDCWACEEGRIESQTCDECGAPAWNCRSGPGGVYMVSAPCGLIKIGLSNVNVYARAGTIVDRTKGRARVLALLPGAGRRIERWLHLTFADIRDPRAAMLEGLPHHTEWFWPSPSVERLASGDAFIWQASPWEERDPQPWEPNLR